MTGTEVGKEAGQKGREGALSECHIFNVAGVRKSPLWSASAFTRMEASKCESKVRSAVPSALAEDVWVCMDGDAVPSELDEQQTAETGGGDMRALCGVYTVHCSQRRLGSQSGTGP
eukprot:CAMPEP_0174842142 /NCGR_PEP_ID=MMETSP1114-20130205/9724_1 /TAXON_ID=312471 /ORGANISM="Neobodo designis, Strain CCAP 1951/1" /LENGTH=115 /DNA_ID=CAMNT_0016076339 /DNA_START=111 /DNA_END=460 /DNA_ORIENTATION=+